uniref:CS domain-containing protein n=1 Tax=Eutreptiella gymnastica TaxID=73025 RepID=A0A7S1IUJ1_9EUGL|mmetsp:Transcript_44353/g.79550  ORF Transcript_44353/g.79550 Transcript_44353/m.79550 type:complete len:653 (+) Transcript_44353:132-2090(+)
MSNRTLDLSRWDKIDVDLDDETPVATSTRLAASNDPVLQQIARETGLNADLILMCARAMALEDQQIELLPMEQKEQTLRLRNDPHFGPVQRAAKQYQEATFTIRIKPEAKSEAPKPKLPDPEKAVRNCELAMNMTEAQVRHLPEQQQAAVRTMREDPLFESIRQKVREAQKQRKEDTQKRKEKEAKIIELPDDDPVSVPIGPPVAPPSSTQSDFMRKCGKALMLNDDQIQSLPKAQQIMLKAVRDAPEFGYLRGAVQKSCNDEEIEVKLQSLAQKMGAEPEGLRAVAQAMRLTEEEVHMLGDQERVSIMRIRNDDAFAEVREAINTVGLARIMSVEEKVAFLALQKTHREGTPEMTPEHIATERKKLEEVQAEVLRLQEEKEKEKELLQRQREQALKEEEEARARFEEEAAQRLAEEERKKQAAKEAQRQQYKEMMARLKRDAQQPEHAESDAAVWDMMGQAVSLASEGNGVEARRVMDGALQAAKKEPPKQPELSVEDEEQKSKDDLTKFMAMQKIMGALKHAESQVNQGGTLDLETVNQLAEAFRSAERDVRYVEQGDKDNQPVNEIQPTYSAYTKYSDHAVGEYVLKIDLPALQNMQDVVLDGTSDHFSLQAPGQYSLELPLPCTIDPEAVTAKFSKKTRVLTVTMPKV